MQRNSVTYGSLMAVALSGLLAAGIALADKPSWAGEKGAKGQGQSQGKGESQGQNQGHGQGGGAKQHFNDQNRVVVREYYGSQYQSGRCPPGLAKKNNGCMPPGQAKKWAVGQPLPRDVIFYEVPQPLVIQIGVPPSGYRYVRVAGDILMIAIGTAMVIDAIQDLGR